MIPYFNIIIFQIHIVHNKYDTESDNRQLIYKNNGILNIFYDKNIYLIVEF